MSFNEHSNIEVEIQSSLISSTQTNSLKCDGFIYILETLSVFRHCWFSIYVFICHYLTRSQLLRSLLWLVTFLGSTRAI